MRNDGIDEVDEMPDWARMRSSSFTAKTAEVPLGRGGFRRIISCRSACGDDFNDQLLHIDHLLPGGARNPVTAIKPAFAGSPRTTKVDHFLVARLPLCPSLRKVRRRL